MWESVSFGPDFGTALDSQGRVFIWGHIGEDFADDGLAGTFIGPVAIEFQGEARGCRFVDVQCSSMKIFMRTARGQTST